MSRAIKVDDRVYHQLDELRDRRQTFSDVVGDLLDTRLKVLELFNVLEGQLKYQEWKHKKEGG